MEFRHLGQSGLVVSSVGIGCGQLGRNASEPGRRVVPEESAQAVIEAALDAGVTLFDTSDSYGDSEIVLGRYLGSHRSDVVLATKFGTGLKGDLGNDFGARGARRYVRQAIERSLRRLNTDWIDLYQIHQPDPITPIEETLSVLTELVHEGKVRYLGSSNFRAWQIADAHWLARTGGHEHFISAQNQYSLMNRKIEEDIVPACHAYGVGLITWRPLANGLLSGRYGRDSIPPSVPGRPGMPSDDQLQLIEKLEAFARSRGISMLDVAIGALTHLPDVGAVIVGATSGEQVRANVDAASWIPNDEDRRELDNLTTA